MTSRDRILASLRGQERDRVPWIPLCSQSFFAGLWSAAESAGREGPVERPDGWKEDLVFRARFYNDHGMDFMGWMDGADVSFECPGVTSRRTEIAENEFLTETTTPAGELTSIDSYHAASFSFFSKKHRIRNVDDLKILNYTVRNTGVRATYDEARSYLEVLGDRGVAFNALRPPAVQDALLGEFEPETLLLWVCDGNEELLEYESLRHRLDCRIVELKASGPFQVFCNYGVLGLGLVSPEIVRRHYQPFLKHYNSVLRSRRKIMICHTSGEPIGAILEDIASLRLDGLCGLSCPAPRNDPEIWEIADRLPPQTALCGGLTPDFLYRAGRDQVKDAVRELLDKMAGDRRFLLGTADDVVPGTPVENLEAVSEVVSEFS